MSFLCPRRVESRHPSSKGVRRDDWVPNHLDPSLHSCSFCGSLDPAEVLDGIRERRLRVSTTSKNYKIYLLPSHAKFYFQHFSIEQRHEFLALYNERRNADFFETLTIAGRELPVGFTVPPFFAKPEKPANKGNP